MKDFRWCFYKNMQLVFAVTLISGLKKNKVHNCVVVVFFFFLYHLYPTCSLTAVVRLLERSQATSPQFWLPPHTTALCDLSRFPCQTPSPSPHQQKVSSSTCCPLLTHSTYSTANTALPHSVVAHARNTLDCAF